MVAAMLALGLTGCAASSPPENTPGSCQSVVAPVPGTGTPIEVVAGEEVLPGVLDDTAAAADLVAQLPLTVELRDSFGVAKVGVLPAGLDPTGAALPCGFAAGAIGYSPADRAIAIFYPEPPGEAAAPGAIQLGRLTGELQPISAGRTLRVTIRQPG